MKHPRMWRKRGSHVDLTRFERSSPLLPYDPAELLAIDDIGVDTLCDRKVRDRFVSDATCERFYIEIVGGDGRAASVELRVRLDTVEIVLRGHLLAVFDLDALREWWASPEGHFSGGPGDLDR